MKYEVGQQVIYTTEHKGVIVRTDDSIAPYCVKFVNGDIEWLAESELIACDLQAENERLRSELESCRTALQSVADAFEIEHGPDTKTARIKIDTGWGEQWYASYWREGLARRASALYRVVDCLDRWKKEQQKETA